MAIKTLGVIMRHRNFVVALIAFVLANAVAFASAISEPLNEASSNPGNDPEFPRFELFAGYSYLPETDSLTQSFSDSGHGFGASIGVNLDKHFGVLVDADSHEWTVHGHGDASFYRGDQNIRLTYLSVGPRFVARHRRLSAFGFTTFDVQMTRYSGQTIIDQNDPQGPTYGPTSSKAYGLGLGGGVDISLANHIAIRAIQVNYSLGGFGEGPGRKLRIKSGIVFKF